MQVVFDYTTALRVKLPTACILVKAVEKAGIQTALLKAKVQTVRKKIDLNLEIFESFPLSFRHNLKGILFLKSRM